MLGLWLLHLFGKRYIGIFFDPVLACNLRCRMCYFSDEEKRQSYRGMLNYEEIEGIAAALFHRGLKLQIGCGAEPSIHKDLVRIIALGKRYRIPYISLTTNGNLLSYGVLLSCVEAGLDEITLSVHGLSKESYEFFMVHADFERFLGLLRDIACIKERYPNFKLRINYTMNKDNVDELSHIWDVIGYGIDVLQLRPVQCIGKSEYRDFDRSYICAKYDDVLLPIIKVCRERGITILVPDKQNIRILEEGTADDSIEQAAYCYISPKSCWKDDFDYRRDTFESYARTHGLASALFKGVFAKSSRKRIDTTRKMNYDIR